MRENTCSSKIGVGGGEVEASKMKMNVSLLMSDKVEWILDGEK